MLLFMHALYGFGSLEYIDFMFDVDVLFVGLVRTWKRLWVNE